MVHVLSLGRFFHRPVATLATITLILVVAVWVSCAATTGACVGAGGVLSQPNCKDGWTASECSDWNNQGVDGATWSFHANSTCASLGY